MKNRTRRLYLADYLITPDGRIDTGAVLCENERILAVGGLSAFQMEPELEVFEFMNAYLTPGFIDTHIHGAGGFDASSVDLSPKPIESMSTILAERGVTSFFPTVVAAPREQMLSNLQRLAGEMARELPARMRPGSISKGRSSTRSNAGRRRRSRSSRSTSGMRAN